MAVNVCWTFGYGTSEDNELADRFESHRVYMNPHEVVAKIKEIRERTTSEYNDDYSEQIWFGADIKDVETLLTYCKPNSTHLIWMDKYCGEWFSVREIKW